MRLNLSKIMNELCEILHFELIILKKQIVYVSIQYSIIQEQLIS